MCYAAYYAAHSKGHDRFVAQLWSAWYSKLAGARAYVDSFHDKPDTVGYQNFYVLTQGRPERAVEEIADRTFAYSIGESIAGLNRHWERVVPAP